MVRKVRKEMMRVNAQCSHQVLISTSYTAKQQTMH